LLNYKIYTQVGQSGELLAIPQFLGKKPEENKNIGIFEVQIPLKIRGKK